MTAYKSHMHGMEALRGCATSWLRCGTTRILKWNQQRARCPRACHSAAARPPLAGLQKALRVFAQRVPTHAQHPRGARCIMRLYRVMHAHTTQP